MAARNILISEDQTCKVADFGFARDVTTSRIYERKSEGGLPIRWMAPESLYDNLYSIKSDIWSFGILMWEVVTLGSTPYPGCSAAEVMKKVCQFINNRLFVNEKTLNGPPLGNRGGSLRIWNIPFV